MQQLESTIVEIKSIADTTKSPSALLALQYLELAKFALESGNPIPFTREELINIRERSLYFSFPFNEPISPLWVDAYRQLGFAADRLDAMMSRTPAPNPQSPTS